jgi:tRNA threonylcarbamoyladenosine biosynthesis protein TsaB
LSIYLAIDTATDYGSVAVGEPGNTIAELLVAKRRHATALMPTIELVLRIAGVGYSDLTGIAVADGPGSFTGLRIGFATAKGIALEYDRLSLVTAPSLLVLAWGFRAVHRGPIAALYDALRGDVFAAVYRFEDEKVLVDLPPMLGTVTQLTELCGVKPSFAVGDGAVAQRDLVFSWTGREPVGPPVGVPRAGSLLEMMTASGATAVVQDPQSFEPEYGRLAEAQVRWETEHGRELGPASGTQI